MYYKEEQTKFLGGGGICPPEINVYIVHVDVDKCIDYMCVFVAQVDKSPSISSAIDLVLGDSTKVESVPVQKPKLSQKAWNRLSSRNRRKVNPGGNGGGGGGTRSVSPQRRENSPTGDTTGV